MPNQLKTPFLAFYAGRQYRDAFFRWSGTGCAYLLVLSALCWIPTALSFQKALSVFVGKSAPGIVSQLPEMTFRSGELAVNARQPYTVVNPATGQPLAVIDTTGAIKSLNETPGHPAGYQAGGPAAQRRAVQQIV